MINLLWSSLRNPFGNALWRTKNTGFYPIILSFFAVIMPQTRGVFGAVSEGGSKASVPEQGVPETKVSALRSGAPQMQRKSPLIFEDPWIRETAPGQKNAALYGKVRNVSTQPVTVRGLFVAGASHAEFHQSLVDSSGVSVMRPLAATALAPGKTLDLTPGGNHGMIMGLQAPYKRDQKIVGKIILKDGAEVKFEATVRP